jgi:hypothetical protein
MSEKHNNLPILEDSPAALELRDPRYPVSPVTDKPEIPANFYRMNERGLVEVIDMHTGRILCVQSSHQDLLQSKWDRLVRIDTPQGPVWLEKTLNFDMVPRLHDMPFSKVIGDLICSEIAMGATFIEATEKFNVPYNIASQWRREHEEFKLALMQARRDRAEHFHDEVVDVARNQASPKDKIAALQWAAEKGNPDDYGKQTKVTKEHKGSVTIVISTGIRRPGDQGYVEAAQTTRDVTEPAKKGEDEEVEQYAGGSDDS